MNNIVSRIGLKEIIVLISLGVVLALIFVIVWFFGKKMNTNDNNVELVFLDEKDKLIIHQKNVEKYLKENLGVKV